MPLSSPNFEYTTTNIPAFLSKLWTLVEDAKYDELIAWDATGFSFHVYDQTRFAREILPRFFKHNNMASFIRQLNMYGFRKVNSIDHGSLKNEKEDMEFHHPYFIRGKEQFLEFIKRKVPDLKANPASQSGSVNTSNLNSNQQLSLQYPQIKNDELNKVLDDVNCIKSKQKMVDDSLFNVKKENEALWKEIATLRQKHQHQQQIVNKLIHFLVHLVNPTSMSTIKRTRPLMIDSHAANLSSDDNLTGVDLEDGENLIDDGEDDEELYQIDSLRNVTNGFTLNRKPTQQTRHSIVEIKDHEDDDSDDEQRTRKRSLSRNNLDYINDAEIETINASKNTNLNGHKLIHIEPQPAIKKLKVNGPPNPSEITTINLYQPNTNLLDLKNQLENSQKKVTKEQDFLDTNLFLNTSNNTIVPPVLTNMGQESQVLDSASPSITPILTSPNSPHMNAANKIFLSSSGGGAGDTPNGIISPDLIEPTSQSDQNSNLSNYKRPISSLKTPYSSSQMNDHVESLQLDLNSIKEFLTQNSFNQVDPYTINSLFSPIVLDQMDNEQCYLEAPLPVELNIDGNRAQSTLVPTQTLTNTSTSEANLNSNGAVNRGAKIVGTELIQYEPFNISDFFQFDDIFTNDLKPTCKIKEETNTTTTSTNKSGHLN